MTHWYPLDIPLSRHTRARRQYAHYARTLQRLTRESQSHVGVLEKRDVVLNDAGTISPTHLATFRACIHLITDLALQGWKLRIGRDNTVKVAPPAAAGSREKVREAIRAQEVVKRDAQLSRNSVRAFIASMEAKHVFEDRFVSIFDLMRDGAHLASELRKSRDSPLNGDALADVVKPYIQFVDVDARCSHTGFRLMDIWRYFRHTWTNQYTSVPGRTMNLLVRDAAAPNHPVMGIASIASPIIQIGERDKWLGWHPDTFVERVRSAPTAKLARWLVATVDAAISEVYKADFMKEKLVTPWRIKKPTKDDTDRLRKYSIAQKKRHQRYSRRSDFNRRKSDPTSTRAHWINQARTPLFRSKRAQSLADLLDLRMQLQTHIGNRYSAKRLKAFADTGTGRRVIGKIVRKAKADRVGVAMADITVCGAVQPYNAILGGKLVSMLAVSPTVVAEYKRKYAEAISQIASSMAGRPIIRKPCLVYFGTTSLYGNGSSQYNRIKIPAQLLGGASDENLTFKELGQSESFGTSQFSDETVEALVNCLRQSTNGERVQSIFGEGVSPRLRKVREGLDLLQLPSDTLLQHGRRRSIYGIVLAENTGDYLLGIDRRPRYLFKSGLREDIEIIVGWWRHRWLSRRVQSDKILDQVAQHRQIHPMCHGARVTNLLRESGADA